MAVFHQPLLRSFGDRLCKNADDFRTGAPGEVESGYRVTVTVGTPFTALSPPDDRQELHAEITEVVALLPCREVQVGLGPLAPPVVFLAVELRGVEPVSFSELAVVLDSEAALLWRVDEKDSSQRPESLSAEVVGILLIDKDDLLAGLRGLIRRDQSGKSGADDNNVCSTCGALCVHSFVFRP